MLPFCCTMLCKHGLSRHAVSLHLSDPESVTFVKANKHIFKKLSPSGSQTTQNQPKFFRTKRRKLRSTFCTIEANYWQTRSIVRPLRQQRILSGVSWPRAGNLKFNTLVRIYADHTFCLIKYALSVNLHSVTRPIAYYYYYYYNKYQWYLLF